MRMPIEPIAYRDGAIDLIDQRRLPDELVILRIRSASALAEAICDMAVRGAPSIGVAAAYGVVLEMRTDATEQDPRGRFRTVRKLLGETRPTAVNLRWALDRMERVVDRHADGSGSDLIDALEEEAARLHQEETAANRRIGELGASLVPQRGRVLTHCNTGALAAAGVGTALGVVRAAWALGRLKTVFVDETRPRLQGARLTAWELDREGIPYFVIADGTAASLMARGEVDVVMVGADRIARNGDVANKIGTYALAVLSHHHGIPFYVAAPISTVDPTCPEGTSIPIEERPPDEVRTVRGVLVTVEGAPVRNPAFDITPHGLISGIVTERGVLTEPYEESIGDALSH